MSVKRNLDKTAGVSAGDSYLKPAILCKNIKFETNMADFWSLEEFCSSKVGMVRVSP